MFPSLYFCIIEGIHSLESIFPLPILVGTFPAQLSMISSLEEWINRLMDLVNLKEWEGASLGGSLCILGREWQVKFDTHASHPINNVVLATEYMKVVFKGKVQK